MLNQNFVIAGALLNFAGALSYLNGTVRGTVKPNRVSWFIWTLAPLTAFFAEMSQGVGLRSLMTFTVGFNPLLIFVASFIHKDSAWNLTRFDLICGGLSLAGLLLWYVTRVGNIAIAFSIAADALAALPTLRKAYHAPETENYHGFLTAAVSGVITLLTIKTWNVQTYAFPLYIVLVCMVLVVTIKFRVGRLISSQALT